MEEMRYGRNHVVALLRLGIAGVTPAQDQTFAWNSPQYYRPAGAVHCCSKACYTIGTDLTSGGASAYPSNMVA